MSDPDISQSEARLGTAQPIRSGQCLDISHLRDLLTSDARVDPADTDTRGLILCHFADLFVTLTFIPTNTNKSYILHTLSYNFYATVASKI